MTSAVIKELTAIYTGNRTDCWNTPVEFVGDVVKFLMVRLTLTRVVMIENPNVPAKVLYTEETNGLAHPG